MDYPILILCRRLQAKLMTQNLVRESPRLPLKTVYYMVKLLEYYQGAGGVSQFCSLLFAFTYWL